jgi:hypothetical protein
MRFADRPLHTHLADDAVLWNWRSQISKVPRKEGGPGVIAPLNAQKEQRRRIIEDQIVGLAQAWGSSMPTLSS